MNRNLLFYVLIVAVFSSLLAIVFRQGRELDNRHVAEITSVETMPVPTAAILLNGAQAPQRLGGGLAFGLLDNLEHPLSLLLLQIITIVVFSKALAYAFSKIGQPLVVGEIVAGILLGPSVLGLLWPQFSSFVFQPDSLPNLHFLSQLGLILFMFVVGLEFDTRLLQHTAHTAVVVSHASIVLPFFLGVGLAYFLFGALAPAGVSFTAFGLFMGIAMSITAFPVLARILHERGLMRTPLGALAITCAAADDVTAWCILAAVIAVVQASTLTGAVFTVLLTGAYVVIMLGLVRPLLERLDAKSAQGHQPHRALTLIALVMLFLSALTTEVIGVHALFGAFLAGICMPARVGFRKVLASKIEDVSLMVLLPLFFALTGLKTQIGLLDSGKAWLLGGLIVLVAVVGKFGGSLLAAKFTGQSWSDAFAIGALLNTRGLMELIVLNIGYDLGVLSPTVFTMLVLMAITTTLMTSPALDLIRHLGQRRAVMTPQSLPDSL